MTGFRHSRSLVDPVHSALIFVYVFPSVGYLSTIKNVIRAGWNVIIVIIAGFALLVACLNVVIKLLAEGALSTVVWWVGVHWCRFGNISLLCSLAESTGNYCSSVVACSWLLC